MCLMKKNNPAPEKIIRDKFRKMKLFLNERQIRLFAAAEANSLGYGGISTVAEATGLSRVTITFGCKELAKLPEMSSGIELVRKTGGGRKKVALQDQTLKTDLEKLIDPFTRGDPESPLKWTAKSVRNLSDELNAMGHQTSHRMVAEMLHDMEYSLQANKKTIEGSSHEDRNEQFEYINKKVTDYQSGMQPVISVDTKKKELVGNFKNVGRELCFKGSPTLVNGHDFPDPELGKVAPYGIYDIGHNVGWVNVGIDHDTAQFAVQSIRTWWFSMGKELYSEAKQLLITADCGGSNGARVKLWKIELQKLAIEIGLKIQVCHFPPGTSKWNKIEHRLFSFISQNWRGKPLTSHQVIVDLIAATKTKAGLKVKCSLDGNKYPIGIKISDREMKSVKLVRDEFHGNWNYAILPS
jgi:hypothetical protein